MSQIISVTSSNGYPKQVRNYITKPLETKISRPILADDVEKKIWLELLYNGKIRRTVVNIFSNETKTLF